MIRLENIIKYSIFSILLIPIFIFYIALITDNTISIELIIGLIIIMSSILIFTFKKKLSKIVKIKITKEDIITTCFFVIIVGIFTFSATIPEGTRFDCADNWIYKNTKTEKIVQYCDPELEGYENRIPNKIELTNLPLDKQIENAEKNTFLELTSFCSYNNTGSILGNYKNIPISSDEPYSTAIHISTFYSLFKDNGIKLFYGLMIGSIFFFTFLISNKLSKNYILSILIGIGTISLSIFSMGTIHNPNYLGSTLMLIMIWFLIKENKRSFLLAGITYGFIGSVRPVMLIISPIILVYLLLSKKKKTRIKQFIAGSIIGVLPTLILNSILYQNPFQFPGFMFFPEIEHSFLGVSFFLNTALNYPFFTHLVRTPWYPYPMYIYLPLIIIKNIGLALLAVFPIGLMKLSNKNRTLLAGIPAVFTLFLMINENWMFEKTTLLNLIFPLIMLVCGIGILKFIKTINKAKTIAIFFGTLITLFITINLLVTVDVPEDPRSIMINEDNFNFYRKNTVSLEKDILKTELIPDIRLPQKRVEIHSKNWLEQISDSEISKSIMRFNIVRYDGKDFFIIPNTEKKDVESFFRTIDKKTIESIDISKKQVEFKNIGYSNADIEYSFDMKIINDKLDEYLDVKIYIGNISRKKPLIEIAPAIQINNSNNSIFTIYIDGNELY